MLIQRKGSLKANGIRWRRTSSAGAAHAEDGIKPFGRILSNLIAGHHAGLPDWYSSDTGGAALSVRLAEGRENLEHLSSIAAALSAKLLPMTRPAFVKAETRGLKRIIWPVFFVSSMVASRAELVD